MMPLSESDELQVLASLATERSFAGRKRFVGDSHQVSAYGQKVEL